MNRTIKTTLAAIIAAASLTAPAMAGGQLSFSYTPSDADEQQAVRTGLAIYQLVEGIEANGGITQNGSGNSAGVAQNGGGNTGIVHQEGNGHNGTVQQNGNNNSCGLFQFGEGTDGHCVQNGNGQTGITTQFGW